MKEPSITGFDVLPEDVEVIVSVRPILFVEKAKGVSEFVDDGPFEDASGSQRDGLLTAIDHANVGVAPEGKEKVELQLFVTKTSNVVMCRKIAYIFPSNKMPEPQNRLDFLSTHTPPLFILTRRKGYSRLGIPYTDL